MNETLAEFYKENRDLLLRRLAYGAGTPEAAEDVLQEAFVRALVYQTTFDPEKKELGAWFNTIMRNALRDYKRDEWLFGMGDEFDEELYDPQEMPLQESELIKKIYELVDAKEEEHQQVLLLYFDKHYSREDISKISPLKIRAIDQIILRFKQEVIKRYGT